MFQAHAYCLCLCTSQYYDLFFVYLESSGKTSARLRIDFGISSRTFAVIRSNSYFFGCSVCNDVDSAGVSVAINRCKSATGCICCDMITLISFHVL